MHNANAKHESGWQTEKGRRWEREAEEIPRETKYNKRKTNYGR